MCIKCGEDWLATIDSQVAIIDALVPISYYRVLAMYHEGFTAAQISEFLVIPAKPRRSFIESVIEAYA